MVEAPSLVTGLDTILYDNKTEFPDTINTLQRFNLYPEVQSLPTSHSVHLLCTVVSVSGVQDVQLGSGSDRSHRCGMCFYLSWLPAEQH